MAQDAHEKDLVVVYIQKFCDAVNNVVTLMFGVSFGIYALLAAKSDLRQLAADYVLPLAAIAIVGNFALILLLYRLWYHEDRMLTEITSNVRTRDSVLSAFHMRLILFLSNMFIYFFVIGLNWYVRNYLHAGTP